MFFGNHIKVDPLSVRSGDHAFGTQHISVRTILLERPEDIGDLLLCVCVDRLSALAGEDLVRMMMPFMAVMMMSVPVIVTVIMAAAFAVSMVMFIMMVLIMLMIVVVSMLMVMPAALAVPVVVSVSMFVAVFMIVVMPAALAVPVVMSALRADDLLEQLFFQGLAGFHCLQDLLPRKLRDRSRDKRGFAV